MYGKLKRSGWFPLGGGDNRSCVAALKNSVTYTSGKHKKTAQFFVPWLELPRGDGNENGENSDEHDDGEQNLLMTEEALARIEIWKEEGGGVDRDAVLHDQ